jgi:hypothetical protein
MDPHNSSDGYFSFYDPLNVEPNFFYDNHTGPGYETGNLGGMGDGMGEGFIPATGVAGTSTDQPMTISEAQLANQLFNFNPAMDSSTPEVLFSQHVSPYFYLFACSCLTSVIL